VTTRDEARRFFDAIAGRYDREYAPTRDESRRRMRRVLEALGGHSRVLDLGVGTGRELSRLLDGGYAVTGLDVSPEMLARCARRSRPVPLVLADLWGPLPFAKDSFDAVLALHGTLAHPPSEGALEPLADEVSRVLSPAGVFVAEVPVPGWLLSAPPGLTRTGPTEAVFTDPATGAPITASLFDERRWRHALEAHFCSITTAEDSGELFLVASKTRG
jgi:SAM-dependent methyltransferase